MTRPPWAKHLPPDMQAELDDYLAGERSPVYCAECKHSHRARDGRCYWPECPCQEVRGRD